VSTAATAVAVGGVKVETQVRSTREDANEILMMLEKTMERVCEWSERIETQSSVTVERDVQVWKRRLVKCEETLKRKVAALTEAEKEQVALRQAMEAKDAELAKVRTELEEERRTLNRFNGGSRRRGYN
jgi:DNA repair ATPase RecN